MPNNPLQQPTNVVNSDLNKSATVTSVNNQEVQSVSTQSSNVSSEPVDLLKSNAQVNNQSNHVTPGFCPNCGTRVPDNAKICMICGQKLI